MTTSTINGQPASPGLLASALLGGIAAIVLLIVWGGFWAGLAVSVMWAWFIVPVFGLPALSIAQAYGIVLLVGLMTAKEKTEKDSGSFAAVLGKGFLRTSLVPALVLLVGYIVKAWA
ncbi:MAG: hypothetical protein I8H71_00915 [Xanthomonadaceae bacterium]|nr:hypothetical protein [Xanthomonadaceae bacterium]